MRVYRPMSLKAGREARAPRPPSHRPMSSSGYSSARLRPRRAGLRFTRCAHLTNGPIQHWSFPDQTQHFFYSRIMEEICEWENLKEAMRRVKTNKGSAGIDGMTVDELPDYRALLVIRERLLRGTYKPQPVKRVEIPKPDGGVRKLGIPTALDRFVQQAVMQVLQRHWEPTFSDSSYGFGRAAQLIRLWHKRRSTSLQATAGWWISIWRNSSIESITTN